MTSATERNTATSTAANGSPQGQQLQEAATGLMDQAARTADAQASTTMTQVGDTLQKVATHIRMAGDELRSDQPQVAGFISTAAEKVDGAATYLRDHDASEALDSVQRFARSQPALVIGAGLAAGLIIGRVLRGGAETAAERGSEMGYRGRYGGTYDSARGYRASSYGTSGYGESRYGSTGYGSADYGSSASGASDYGTSGGATTARSTDDMLRDSATGDAVRDEAPTARSR